MKTGSRPVRPPLPAVAAVFASCWLLVPLVGVSSSVAYSTQQITECEAFDSAGFLVINCEEATSTQKNTMRNSFWGWASNRIENREIVDPELQERCEELDNMANDWPDVLFVGDSIFGISKNREDTFSIVAFTLLDTFPSNHAEFGGIGIPLLNDTTNGGSTVAHEAAHVLLGSSDEEDVNELLNTCYPNED